MLLKAQLLQKLVTQPGIPPETAMKVYRRYLKLEPTHVEEYIAYLKGKVDLPIQAWQPCFARNPSAAVASVACLWPVMGVGGRLVSLN